MAIRPPDVQKASKKFCQAVDELGPLDRWDQIMKTLKGHATLLQCQKEGGEERSMSKVFHKGYAEYREDGSITLYGSRDGYPRFTAVVPSPDINTRSPEDRERRHADACDMLALQGYYITSQKYIRNPAFDELDQKTTLEVMYRPCKDEGEMRVVKERILKILDRKIHLGGY